MRSTDVHWLPKAPRLTIPNRGAERDGKCYSAAKPSKIVLLWGLAEMKYPPIVLTSFHNFFFFLNKRFSICCKPFDQFQDYSTLIDCLCLFDQFNSFLFRERFPWATLPFWKSFFPFLFSLMLSWVLSNSTYCWKPTKFLINCNPFHEVLSS